MPRKFINTSYEDKYEISKAGKHYVYFLYLFQAQASFFVCFVFLAKEVLKHIRCFSTLQAF